MPLSSSSLSSTYPSELAICDDTLSLAKAITALSSCRTIFLLCAGTHLGAVGGELNVIALQAASWTVGTQSLAPPQTFIFDILSLLQQQISLHPLFTILVSPSVLKVMWDGRRDYSGLHHNYNIDLRNVLDLQLVDLRSRSVRGEGKEEHLARLRQSILPRLLDIEDAWQRYGKVQKLSSLVQSLQDHKPDGYDQLRRIRGAFCISINLGLYPLTDLVLGISSQRRKLGLSPSASS